MKTKKKTARTHKSELLDDFFSVKPSEKKQYAKTEKNMLLAMRIEDAMKKNGFNKSGFAEAMQVQPSMVTRWLSGTHNFTVDTLYDIEELLSISIINHTEPSSVVALENYSLQLKSSSKLPAGALPAGNFISDFDCENLQTLSQHKEIIHNYAHN